MSVIPLLNMPSSSCIASVVFSIMRVTSRSGSPYTLEEQANEWPGEKWLADVTMPPMVNKIVAGEWKAFGVALKGTLGTFYLGDPSAKVPNGVATGTPLVDGAGQEGNALNTKGWTPSTPKILRAGDMVQIGTGAASRLHMQMVDVDSDGAGKCQLTLQPAMRYSPADNLALNVHDAKGIFRMSQSTFQWNATPGSVIRISFQAEEVVSA